MRVLLPLAEPILPGKARFVAIVNTAVALAHAGIEVKLILPGPREAVARYASDDLGIPIPPGLEVLRIAGWHRALGHPFTWNRITVGAALRALDRFRGDGPAIVHVRHEKLALGLARRPRKDSLPLVFEAHTIGTDYERERGRSARRAAAADERMRRILDRSSALVAISEGLKDEIVRRYGFRGPAAVARSAIDPQRFPYAWPAEHAKPRSRAARIVYVGRLGAWKAVESIVHALGRIPDARLVLIGGGDEREVARLREAGHSAGADGRIEITGRVGNREVAARIASADVAVHALPEGLSIAARDTSPLKLLEYLAVGIPVVAPDLPSIREIVADGESALLVAPGDPDALTSAIRRLLGDPQLQLRLSGAGRAVAERHTWAIRARTLVTLYHQALA